MFDEIASSSDAKQVFQNVARLLVEAGQFHELFDLRLVQKRHELGLSLARQSSLEELAAEVRRPLEDAYLEACREVGQLLLEAGRPHDAWLYLRPAREKNTMRHWLEHTVADDQQADELIELALHQAVDPERGFAWLLAQRGTCNAITELEGLSASLSVADLTACAAVLVRHVEAELLGNIREQLRRSRVEVAGPYSLGQLLTTRGEVIREGSPHVDSSHLLATVRFARLLESPGLVQKAVELAGYGLQLPAELQYPDHPPFEDSYASHLLFFQAQLGENVEEAIEYFRRRAGNVAVENYGTSAIEAYLILLERLHLFAEAMEGYADFVTRDIVLSPHAPTLLELTRASGNWDRYLEISAALNDIVSFTIGQLYKSGQLD